MTAKINESLQQRKDLILKHHSEPKNLDELANIVLATIRREIIKHNPDARVLGFSWDIRHRDVSVSHNCPIQWDRRTDGWNARLPGWDGRVWIRYTHSIWPASAVFAATLTYPGTGGIGSYHGPWAQVAHAHYEQYGNMAGLVNAYPRPMCFSWDYRFFDSDWPLLQEVDDIAQDKTYCVLANRSQVTKTHHFIWEDPEVKLADKKYLEFIKTLEDECQNLPPPVPVQPTEFVKLN